MDIGVPQFMYEVHLSDSSSDRTLIYHCACFNEWQAGSFALKQNNSYDTVDKIVDENGNSFGLQMTPSAVAVEKEAHRLGALTYKNKLTCVKAGDTVEEGDVYVVTNQYYTRDDSGADVEDISNNRTVIATLRKGEALINVEQRAGVIKSISELRNPSEFKLLSA